MRLTVLGRSPARPNPGEACAGYVVEGGDSRILMDVGPGVVAQLLRRNTPDELDAVVISHMHTDHCLDLITLRYSYPWIDVAKKRLTVIVPPGSTGQLAELALGAGYANFFDKSFIFVEHDGKRPIEIGNLRLEPEETQRGPQERTALSGDPRVQQHERRGGHDEVDGGVDRLDRLQPRLVGEAGAHRRERGLTDGFQGGRELLHGRSLLPHMALESRIRPLPPRSAPHRGVPPGGAAAGRGRWRGRGTRRPEAARPAS